ncbi:hypothetical protein A2U01_0032568 [Trifolium medium]|uniref:Uncharacterized protein n=1 Tax=Trifolium medium TaxID=97028 RepID=A0A392PIJ9_9FABA|nr:hypothetical protein [Trifolium medium]
MLESSLKGHHKTQRGYSHYGNGRLGLGTILRRDDESFEVAATNVIKGSKDATLVEAMSLVEAVISSKSFNLIISLSN